MAGLSTGRRRLLSIFSRSVLVFPAFCAGIGVRSWATEDRTDGGDTLERLLTNTEGARSVNSASDAIAMKELLETFIRRWCNSDYPPTPVSAGELADVERHLDFLMPSDYRSGILTSGLPRPGIKLLNSIVDHEIPIADVSNFHSPSEIIDNTEGWQPAGLPKSAVAFASDCMGNQFYFDRLEGSSSRVWLFDHDFETVKPVATNFSAWIEAFNSLPDAMSED